MSLVRQRSFAGSLLAILIASNLACGKSKKSKGGNGSVSTNPLAEEVTPQPTVSTISESTDETGTGSETVVSPDDAIVTALTSSLRVPRTISFVPPSAGSVNSQLDFLTDQGNFLTGIKVRNPHERALENTNLLLCIAQKLAYTSMENRDEYVAYAEVESCRRPDQELIFGSGESFVLPAAMAAIKVVVKRVDPKDPLLVQFWFDDINESDTENSKRWDVSLRIVAGTSKNRPWGIFRLTWRVFDLDGSAIPPSAEESRSQFGSFEVSQKADQNFVLELMDSNGSSGETFLASGQLELETSNNTFGAGKVRLYVAENQLDPGKDVLFTFDSEHVAWTDLQDNAVVAECLDRDTYQTASKGLHVIKVETNQSLASSPGTAILASLGNDAFAYGWISQGALRFLQPGEAADGDRVKTEVWDSSDEYQRSSRGLRLAAGRLIKHSSHQLAMADIRDSVLEVLDRNSTEATLVSFDGEKFVKLGTRSPRSGSEARETHLASAETYSIGTGLQLFWSSQLGGYVAMLLSAPVSDSTVYYYSQEDVTATSEQMTLKCAEFCPRTNITQSQADRTSGASPYLPAPISDSDLSQLVTYIFEPSRLSLEKNGVAVGLDPAVTKIAGYHSFGIRSGPLFEAAATLTTIHDGWKLPTFYTWEFGTNLSNRSAYLVDEELKAISSGASVFLAYSHEVANIWDETKEGTALQKFIFQDVGGGNIFGSPMTFSDENSFGWVNHISVAAKSWAAANETEFKIYPDLIEVELDQSSSLENCADVAGSHGEKADLPDLSKWKSGDLETQPAGYPPVAVISGKVLGAD